MASLRDQTTGADVLQETSLTAWRCLDRYDRQPPFGPWIRGIAAELVLAHRRTVGREKVYFCDEDLLSRVDDMVGRFHHLVGDTFDEQLDALRGCLERPNGPQRDSIKLHYEHGLHCEEIAGRLELGLEAVKKHLQRGRAQLPRWRSESSWCRALGETSSSTSRASSAAARSVRLFGSGGTSASRINRST